MEPATQKLPEYPLDRIQRAAKLRRFDQLEWGIGDTGEDALVIRMPKNAVKLVLLRNDLGYYKLRPEFGKQFDAGLAERVGEALEKCHDTLAPFGRFTNYNLPIALRALQQPYRSIHAPKKLSLAPAVDKDTPTIRPAGTHSYATVMDALDGRGKVQWGQLASYGSECIQLTMPDPSTSLVILRKHDKDGAYHQVFAQSGNGPAAAHIQQFMTRRATECACGGLRVESLRDLLGEIRRFDTNRAAEPLAGPRPKHRG